MRRGPGHQRARPGFDKVPGALTVNPGRSAQPAYRRESLSGGEISFPCLPSGILVLLSVRLAVSMTVPAVHIRETTGSPLTYDKVLFRIWRLTVSVITENVRCHRMRPSCRMKWFLPSLAARRCRTEIIIKSNVRQYSGFRAYEITSSETCFRAIPGGPIYSSLPGTLILFLQAWFDYITGRKPVFIENFKNCGGKTISSKAGICA